MTLETASPLFGLLLVGGVLLGLLLCCVLPMIYTAKACEKIDRKEEDRENITYSINNYRAED